MEDSKPITSEETQHCLDFIAVNADRGIRKNARRLLSTPLNELCSKEPDNACWRKAARTLTARRSLVSFSTRRSSFDLWASLGHLENLFSDYRRIAPRFTFEQLAGEAGIAVGNEYRLTITNPNRLTALDAACNQMAPGKDTSPMAGGRAMDLRVTRAGPWGGETGELVVEALENHALAGVSSLWLVAHGETTDGLLQVTLDALEIAGWAWAPDFLAERGDTDPVRILDWSYLFERLIQDLDGTPEPAEPTQSFDLSFDTDLSSPSLGTDGRLAEALRSHSALSEIVDLVKNQDQITP